MSALVGRTSERAALDAVLARLPDGGGDVVTIGGEPGIGKSRLLAELAEAASAAGYVVLGAAASEYEDDLPYGVWAEALDPHLRGLDERRLARLGVEDFAGLATAAGGDRHELHRSLGELLEQLAATRPLVVWLDDLHWADAASVDAVAALVRRPPDAPVLLALAAREGRRPDALTAALAGAARDGRVVDLPLVPLSEAEASELVGGDVIAIFALSGGNPFYLEQLARADGVPSSVALALSAELGGLGADARRLLEAAAVVGDPFDPALAAEVAEMPEAAALSALDALLLGGLVRPGGAARRFAFRHPVVRHSVYDGAPGGWRLAAHQRAATALEARGAGVVARAHHIEHAAQLGDAGALELLSSAASTLQAPAPASSARFHAAALRILPDGPEHHERRQQIRVALAEAHSAAGNRAAARATLEGALADARDLQETPRARRPPRQHGDVARRRGAGAPAAARRAERPPGRAIARPHPPAPRARAARAPGVRVRRRAGAGERRAGRRARARGSGARGGGADARRDRLRRRRRGRRARGGVGRVRAPHRRAGELAPPRPVDARLGRQRTRPLRRSARQARPGAAARRRDRP